MNCGYLVTLQGILRFAAVIICLIAASIGTTAFMMSEYNKSCRDSPSEFLVPVTQTTESNAGDDQTFSTSSTFRTRPPAALFQDPQTTDNPGNPDVTSETGPEVKDMAPVLWMERFQISATWLAVVVSVILLLLYTISEDLEYSKIFRTVNFGFHFIFCVLFIVSAIFLAYAAVEIDRQICEVHFRDNREECQKYKLKMSAAAFTILGAVMYAVICVKLVALKLYEEV